MSTKRARPRVGSTNLAQGWYAIIRAASACLLPCRCWTQKARCAIALGETADTMPQIGLSEADLVAIGRDNALTLLPRLKAG